MKKIKSIFIIIVFAALAVPGLVIWLSPDKTYSANENRYLQTRPSFSWEKVFSGDLQNELTDFASDQFFERDFWTETATIIKKGAGYDDIGGVFLGKDHYYFEKVEDEDISPSRFSQNLSFVNKFIQDNKDLDSAVMLVPSPGTILSDKLPKGAELYNSTGMYAQAESMLKGTSFIDLRPQLQEAAGDYIYYRTDHHWTARGAYIGYRQYCQAKGITPKSYDEFGVVCASKDFYGTLYSKALDPAAVPDEVDIPESLPKVTVEYDGTKHDSVYDESKLQTKDKYTVFFGGNYGEVVINTDSDSEKTLLVIKDSFANSMVPYLLDDYSRIIMVDLRYYRGNLQQEVEDNSVTDLLFLYEMSNFAQDNNLYKLNIFGS